MKVLYYSICSSCRSFRIDFFKSIKKQHPFKNRIDGLEMKRNPDSNTFRIKVDAWTATGIIILMLPSVSKQPKYFYAIDFTMCSNKNPKKYWIRLYCPLKWFYAEKKLPKLCDQICSLYFFFCQSFAEIPHRKESNNKICLLHSNWMNKGLINSYKQRIVSPEKRLKFQISKKIRGVRKNKHFFRSRIRIWQTEFIENLDINSYYRIFAM